MTDKKKYTIEFIYVDNGQLYQNDVELTDSEHNRLESYLVALELAGHVEPLDSSSSFISSYIPHDEFIDFETLTENWKNGSLFDWGRDIGVTL